MWSHDDDDDDDDGRATIIVMGVGFGYSGTLVPNAHNNEGQHACHSDRTLDGFKSYGYSSIV